MPAIRDSLTEKDDTAIALTTLLLAAVPAFSASAPHGRFLCVGATNL